MWKISTFLAFNLYACTKVAWGQPAGKHLMSKYVINLSFG